MNIVFPDHIDLTSEVKKKLLDMGVIFFDDNPAHDEVIKRIEDAEIITANYFNVDSKIIDAGKRLKYIIAPAVGYDWIDVDYATLKNIKVINCPSFNSQAVAEHAIALLLAIKRRIIEANSELKEGIWKPMNLSGTELANKKVTLVGHGNIGQRIEKLLTFFGANVVFADSKTSQDELDNMIKNSDVLIVCAQLNEKTINLINSERLESMKKGAFLVNVARGQIVDQKSLLRILDENKIAGAALDVFVDEPLRGKPTDEIIQLANMKNVVATPHIGYNTLESSERLGREIIDNIKAIINGKPINIVN